MCFNKKIYHHEILENLGEHLFLNTTMLSLGKVGWNSSDCTNKFKSLLQNVDSNIDW